MKSSSRIILLTALLLPAPLRAQYQWSAAFDNNATPEGMLLRGNASIQNGALVLTPATGGMQGDAILPKFWPEGQTPAAFSLRCTAKMNGNSGGVIGDGWSISLNDGIPSWLVGENGAGNGPKFIFDTWADSTDATDGGAKLWMPNGMSRQTVSAAPNRLSALIGDRNDWHAVEFSAQAWRQQGSVTYRGNSLISRSGSDSATPVIHADGRLILGARTGDAFNAHQFDNISVTVTPYPVFTVQPQGVQITSGTTPLFEAQTNFNTLPWLGLSTFTLAASATTTWQAKHPGGEWTNIPETTEPILWGADAAPRLILRSVREDQPLWDGDDAALSADGTQFRCVLNWHNGYTTATQPATLRLMPLPQELPGAITLFNAFPRGHAQVTFPHEEGKVLRLTPASPDCLGGFVFEEISRTPQGQPQQVTAFSAQFQYRGSLASGMRADGFSFNVAADLPGMTGDIPAGAGEEGAGTGLTISFDAYENGPEDPAGIDIRWGGQLVLRRPLPPDAVFNDDWITAFVRVESDGTLDLAVNGSALVFDLPLTAWSGLREPRLAFYGRTGALWQQQDIRELSVSAVAAPVVIPPPALVPQLFIHRNAAQHQVTVSWQTAGAETWQLQQSANLQQWTPAAWQIFDQGNGWKVMHLYDDSPHFPQRLFFRLVKP